MVTWSLGNRFEGDDDNWIYLYRWLLTLSDNNDQWPVACLQGQNNDLHNCSCILMNVEYSTATHDLLKWMSHLWVEAEASSEAVSLVCTDSTSYLALSYERVA